MNWCCVYKSQEEGYVLVEIQLWKVLAGTEFWTCDLLTQIFFDLQPNLPYSNWPFSWLHTVGPPINVCLAAENKRKRKSWIIDGGASSLEKMVESLTAKELGGKITTVVFFLLLVTLLQQSCLPYLSWIGFIKTHMEEVRFSLTSVGHQKIQPVF